MDFGQALSALKCGRRVARHGWNGKGVFLLLVSNWASNDTPGHPGRRLPWICMKTADDKFVPWLASQTDILAEDWGIVVDEKDGWRKVLNADGQALVADNGGPVMVKDDGTICTQLIILSKEIFPTATKARAWIAEHRFFINMCDEAETNFHFCQLDLDSFEPDSMRVIQLHPGVSAVIGRLKS